MVVQKNNVELRIIQEAFSSFTKDKWTKELYDNIESTNINLV